MTAEQTMAARLARIMGDVGRIEKKGRITSKGDGPSYKFAKDADVLEAVNPKLAEAGIILVPERTELLSMTENMRGTQIIANIKAAWHVTDGKESLRFETLGQGQDSGDKALPKAQSNARKYAFFMLFHIVTGDDPDQHAEQPEQRGGERPSSPRAAPVQRTPEEQALLDELAAIPGMTKARMTLLADAVEVPKGTRANANQLRAMIARAKQPVAGSAHPAPAEDTGVGETRPPVPEDTSEPGVDLSSAPATAQSESPPAPAARALSMDEVLAAAGEGAEEVPPLPDEDPEGYRAWFDRQPSEKRALLRSQGRAPKKAATA